MKTIRKRVLSLFTAMVMVCSLVVVWPSASFSVNAASFNPRMTAPSTSNSYYYSSNPFYQSGYGMPNCTCYAYGRAWELLGSKPNLSTGNAGKWYWYNKNNGIYSYGSTPKLGAIACWDKYDQNKGHVAVVEAINGGTVTISESHYKGVNFDTRTITSNSSNYLTNMRFCGYIYIGDYNTAHELTIRYNANVGEINGGDYCVDDDMICYSDDYSVVKEVWEEDHGIEYGLYNSSTFGLEKDGYEFLGWSLSPDSGQIFGEDEDLISNDIYPDITDESVTVTMYARWSRYAVTIEYNANGGTISEGDCRVGSGGDIYNDDELVTETWEEGCGHQWGLYNAGTFKLKRTNCDFLGWSLKPDSGRIFGEDEQLIANDIYPEVKDHSGTVKLYAQWGGHTMTEAESEGKTLPDGDYWIVNALDPNYIVHPDSDGAAVNGTNVRMNLYDNSEWSKNDLFTVKYLDNGFYSITQSGTDMAISTENNSLRHRTNIIMLPKSDKELCQWTIRKTTNGYFVQSKSNALYFDVKNDATNNSTLQTFEFNGTKSQIFDFISFKDVHKHSYKEKIILPTCTEDGTKKFSCECGDTYIEIIPATGHDYTKEIVEATCKEDGYAKNTCHNCGDTYTETIPATGHKYVTTTVPPHRH